MFKQIELNFTVNEQRNLNRRQIEQLNGRFCGRCLNEITDFPSKHHRRKYFESGICGTCQQEMFWGE